uniref:Uncharacterized protein n=1 Tax=Eutreptiella gymnastica TaxID=73025 RepID=A0A7S4FTF2_9EUGL
MQPVYRSGIAASLCLVGTVGERGGKANASPCPILGGSGCPHKDGIPVRERGGSVMAVGGNRRCSPRQPCTTAVRSMEVPSCCPSSVDAAQGPPGVGPSPIFLLFQDVWLLNVPPLP